MAQSSDDSHPRFTGTADSGSVVSVYDNGIFLGVTITDTDGNWSFTPLVSIPDGPHQFTFNAANTSGTGGTSASFTIVIDTQPPMAPINLDVSEDGTTVTGNAEAGITVIITDSHGTTLGNATVAPDGHFTAHISPAQINAETLTVKTTDPAGNVGGSDTVAAPDHTAPGAPTDLQVSPDGLHVTGKAEANSTVTVKDGMGNVLGRGNADGNGDFNITPLVPAQLNGQPLLVTAADASTNVSPSATVVAPDITGPDAPTHVAINPDGTIVTGSAEAGSTVKVTDINHNVLGSATAAADGTFTVSIAPAQTNGQPLEVFATDLKGNVGSDTPVNAPDTTSPATPIISAVIDDVANFTGNLINGQKTNDDKPKLEGTAEANSVIKIYDNGALLTTLSTDGSGNWSYTPTTALSQGSHNLAVTASDIKGNTSPAASFNVIVDSIAPLSPTITLVSDNVGTITGPVANGGVTNDPTPTMSGTGEPGSTITLFNNVTSELTTLTVDSSGTWSYTPGNPQSDGTYKLTVSARDDAGNVTAPPAIFTFTIDTQAPTTPSIDTVTDDVGTILGTVDSGMSTDDTKPLLSGSGQAGSIVTIYDNTTPIDTITVDSTGHWIFTPSQPLSEGLHNLSAIATDAAGNPSGTAVFTLTIDTTPPGAPVIVNALGNVATVPTTLISGSSTQSTIPVFSGSGEPGTTIKIYDNGNPVAIGTITVPAGGDWTFTPGSALGQGPHVLTAVATDAAGNTGLPSASFTLTVDTVNPGTPGIPIVTDDKAPILGNVADSGSTNDTTPTFSGTGTAGDTITIYNNATDKLGTTIVRADGSWSFTPETPLGQATYKVTIVETDPAGNNSLPSGILTFTIDTTPPTAPTINSAEDDVGEFKGTLSTNAVTDDNTPEFKGTGTAGDTITLYNGATVIGSAVIDGTGNWSVTPSSPLANGIYNLTAVQSDAAGNPSGSSNTFTLTVNTTLLTAPVVTEIVDDVAPITTPLVNLSFTDDTTPTLKGTGTVGSTVSIFDNGSSVAMATATVGSDGTWTVTLPALNEGTHDLTFSATSLTGNTIGPSTSITLNVDVTRPDAPVVLTLDNTGTLVTGTAELGSTVMIKDNLGNVLGLAKADATTGAWSVTLSPAQTAGQSLTAISQDPAGNQSLPSDFTAVTSGLPHPPSIDHVIDDIGSITGDIVNGKSTDDTLPLLKGSNAAAGATVTIYQDGTVLTTVVADSSGNWNYLLTTPLTRVSTPLPSVRPWAG